MNQQEIEGMNSYESCNEADNTYHDRSNLLIQLCGLEISEKFTTINDASAMISEFPSDTARLWLPKFPRNDIDMGAFQSRRHKSIREHGLKYRVKHSSIRTRLLRYENALYQGIYNHLPRKLYESKSTRFSEDSSQFYHILSSLTDEYEDDGWGDDPRTPYGNEEDDQEILLSGSFAPQSSMTSSSVHGGSGQSSSQSKKGWTGFKNKFKWNYRNVPENNRDIISASVKPSEMISRKDSQGNDFFGERNEEETKPQLGVETVEYKSQKLISFDEKSGEEDARGRVITVIY